MGNLWGQFFRVMTFGESHGVAMGGVIDGCPAGLSIDVTSIQKALNRRRPGNGKFYSSSRKEPDQVIFLSGIENHMTLGSPIAFQVFNVDRAPQEYEDMSSGTWRPSHGDGAYFLKYGIPLPSGGGRLSARETVARVIAGELARQFIVSLYPNYKILSWVERIGPYHLDQKLWANGSPPWKEEDVEASLVRCPDPETSHAMENFLEKSLDSGDTWGGILASYIEGVPWGLGSPVFDKLEADLGKAMLSLPSTKGFEIGYGFFSSEVSGSAHNDPWVLRDGKPFLAQNCSGGVQGGISVGAPLYFRTAFKPISTLFKEQKTLSCHGKKEILWKKSPGRHDVCAVPRAIPLVDGMAHLVIADHLLAQRLSRL